MLAKTLLLTCVLAAAAGAGAAVLVSPRGPEAREQSAAPDESRVEAALSELSRRQGELARELEELRLQTAGLPRREEAGDLEQRIERILAARGAGEASSESGANGEPPQPASREARVREALAQILDPDVSWEELMVLWKGYAEEGLSDELVAEFERRARERPGDPEAQVELAYAYLQKIFEEGNSPLAGVWATKADAAFDAAIALDGEDWDARYGKAVSLSHWPAVFGKQNEAIQHFEILVAQQAQGTQKPQYAETHLLLGNLYQQIGEKEKALAAWQGGLALFPEDPELKKQVQLAGGL